MNLRQFKKASTIKMEQMEINDNDILVLYADLEKLSPKLASQFFDIVKRKINKEVLAIALPNEMFLEKVKKEYLIKYRDRLNEYIDKLGE